MSCEENTWCVDTPDIEGFYCGGGTFEELCGLAIGHVYFYFKDEDVFVPHEEIVIELSIAPGTTAALWPPDSWWTLLVPAQVFTRNIYSFLYLTFLPLVGPT